MVEEGNLCAVYPVDVVEKDAQNNKHKYTLISRAIEDIRRSNTEALREAVQAQQASASENHGMST